MRDGPALATLARAVLALVVDDVVGRSARTTETAAELRADALAWLGDPSPDVARWRDLLFSAADIHAGNFRRAIAGGDVNVLAALSRRLRRRSEES
jgi:hypothetical protein